MTRARTYFNREEIRQEARKLRSQKKWSYKMISEKLNIPLSTIRGWTKDIKVDRIKTQILSQRSRRKPFGKLISNIAIRYRIIEIRGYVCENCEISNWLNKPIVIELHHIDGDSKNNNRQNLRLLCPNCHSQTDDYKNNKHKPM